VYSITLPTSSSFKNSCSSFFGRFGLAQNKATFAVSIIFQSRVMFSQWLLFVCGLLMISDPGLSVNDAESREKINYVEAAAQYGWQVSAGAVTAFEVGTK
jgi:hypothetical protein